MILTRCKQDFDVTGCTTHGCPSGDVCNFTHPVVDSDKEVSVRVWAAMLGRGQRKHVHIR